MSLWRNASRNVIQYRQLLVSKASRIPIFNQSFSQQNKSIWTDLAPNISVNPKVSLVDEGLIIKASGLSDGQPVTIKAETQIGSSEESLISLGCYVADETGCVSTSSQPSLGGTYQGLEPLGPIWSLTSTSSRIPFGALERDHGPDRPLNIKFSLLNGHVGGIDQSRDDVMGEDCDIIRGFMAGNIERTFFKEGPLEGMLYVPTDRGSQPRAAILDFRGAEESHREHLGALLASHGYVTMTTRYPLQTDTLVNINYLEQLYHRLSSHDMVDEGRIGGLSRGDGVAVGLNFAAHLNHLPLQCLLGVNGVSFNTNFGWILPNGTKTDFFPYYERSKSYKPTNGSVSLCSQFEPYRIASILGQVPDCFVPVENIDIPLMMFSSRSNPYLPTQYSMEELKHRLCHAGKRDQLELIEYSDTGHLLDPTYISHIQASHGTIPNMTDELRIAWGGKTTEHARSQRDMWERTLGFFKRHLQK